MPTGVHHYQKWVSLPQKGRDVDGGHFPSRDMAITRSGLSKKGSLCALGVDADADPALDDDVIGQTSKPCRASRSVYADPASINSPEVVAADGASGAAVSGEIAGCVAGSVGCVSAEVNTDYSVTWGFSSPTDPKETCRRSDVLPEVSGALLSPDRDSGSKSDNMGRKISDSKADSPEELLTSGDHHLSSGLAGYMHGDPAGRIGHGAIEDQVLESRVGDSTSAPVILDDDVQTGLLGMTVVADNGDLIQVKASSDTVVADRVIPVSAIARDNNGKRSKVNSLTAGKAKSVVGAGPRVSSIVPSREWVKARRHVNGSQLDAECPITSFSQQPARILDLGDKDFPPFRTLPDSGASREASKVGDGSLKTGAKSEVNVFLSSVPTCSQPVRLGSKYDKGVVGKGKGDTTVGLPSDEAKLSHNWRSLFVNRPKSCSTLAFYNPSTVDGKVTINPPPEAVAEGVGIWEGSLVGQFFDRRLPLHVVRSFVERLWGKHEIPEISITDNGLYIFRFRDLVARDWVLENGPWYMAGRPIIIRFWKPGMEMLNVQITSLPIWVKFFNIPLEY